MYDIEKWCHGVITGPGGFLSLEEHELPIWTVSREEAIARFVIRALANLECLGSGDVLNAIMDKRFDDAAKLPKAQEEADARE